jgi:hypothetical protein
MRPRYSPQLAEDGSCRIFPGAPKPQTALQEFRCEVCGSVSTNPIHWFVIRCGDSNLTLYRWNSETANAPGARHYCGEAHAEVYISRWFDSVCAPPKPNFI